jgi:unsaturated chondroitin disaccharide hydrolase
VRRCALKVLAMTVALGATAGCAASAHPSAPAGTRVADTAPACLSQAPSDLQIAHALSVARARLTADTQALTPTWYPAVTDHAGRWRTTGGGWTSGFFPGSLWLMDGFTGQSMFARAAAAWTAGLTGLAVRTDSHDIGFEIFTSFGNGYGLTHSDAYRTVILRAAASLATRYDPAVGAIRSWGQRDDQSHFMVIVDGLMNLELLFWAAHHGGDPGWAQMASQDALTVRAHFIRPDGSLVHLVDFDPATGAVIAERNPQGYDLHSTWARGQAWAVAGFAIAYRETQDVRFLQAARRTAAYFVGHLPSDCVPYWDFQAPGIPFAPRDSSAGAIAADGLLSLSRLDPDPARRHADLQASGALLAALIGHDLPAGGQALLAHGTADKQTGATDIGTSYGDYYFLDALLGYRRAAGQGSAG